MLADVGEGGGGKLRFVFESDVEGGERTVCRNDVDTRPICKGKKMKRGKKKAYTYTLILCRCRHATAAKKDYVLIIWRHSYLAFRIFYILELRKLVFEDNGFRWRRTSAFGTAASVFAIQHISRGARAGRALAEKVRIMFVIWVQNKSIFRFRSAAHCFGTRMHRTIRVSLFTRKSY